MTSIDPTALAPHYAAFLRPDRVLLTGHSHQAWPDVAREGALRAFEDAARDVDDKWERAFAVAEQVRAAVGARIGASAGEIALGGSTHELVSRFLSALDLRARPRVVTTRGEFHSADRQLRRLAEESVEVVFVETGPLETLAERLASALDRRTSAVIVSSVLFETASVVPELAGLAARARELGVELLVDAYHAFGVVPFTVRELGADAFVVGGGYKYAQWGEGCCWLRVPTACALRPVYTGWFSDFAHLGAARDGAPITYGDRPADRFAGSTYDPTSHYRAAAVIEFFDAQRLTLPALRAVSLRQTSRILGALADRDIQTPLRDDQRGGFVAVRVRDAGAVSRRLRERGVFTDARGDLLRFGPAPYLTDDEIDRGLAAFRDVCPG